MTNKKISIALGLILATLAILISIPLTSAWYDSAWPHRDVIQFQTNDTKTYTNITHGIIVPPHKELRDDLFDVVITDSDDNVIPFAIESHVPNGNSTFLVKFPELQNNTHIFVYYGSGTRAGLALRSADVYTATYSSGISSMTRTQLRANNYLFDDNPNVVFNQTSGSLAIHNFEIQVRTFLSNGELSGVTAWTLPQITFSDINNNSNSFAYAITNTHCTPIGEINNERLETSLTDSRPIGLVAKGLSTEYDSSLSGQPFYQGTKDLNATYGQAIVTDDNCLIDGRGHHIQGTYFRPRYSVGAMKRIDADSHSGSTPRPINLSWVGNVSEVFPELQHDVWSQVIPAVRFNVIQRPDDNFINNVVFATGQTELTEAVPEPYVPTPAEEIYEGPVVNDTTGYSASMVLTSPPSGRIVNHGDWINGTFTINSLPAGFTPDQCVIAAPVQEHVVMNTCQIGANNFAFRFDANDGIGPQNTLGGFLVVRIIDLNETTGNRHIPAQYELWSAYLLTHWSPTTTIIEGDTLNNQLFVISRGGSLSNVTWQLNDEYVPVRSFGNRNPRQTRGVIGVNFTRAGLEPGTYTSLINLTWPTIQRANEFPDFSGQVFGGTFTNTFTVLPLSATICSQGDPNEQLRFNFFRQSNETNPYVTNGTISMLTSAGRNLILQSYTGVSSLSICDNVDANYTADVRITYANTARNFLGLAVTDKQLLVRNLYIDDLADQNIVLALKDGSFFPLEGYRVELQKLTNNTYLPVFSGTTDDQGEVLLRVQDTEGTYNIIVTDKSGVVREIVQGRRFECPATVTESTTTGDTPGTSTSITRDRVCRITKIVAPEKLFIFEDIEGDIIMSIPSFTQGTYNIVSVNYYSKSFNILNLTMIVRQENEFGRIMELCNRQISSYSGIFNCRIDNLVSENPLLVTITSESNGKVSLIYNNHPINLPSAPVDQNLLAVFVFAAVILMLASLHNKTVAMLSVPISIIIGIAFNLLEGSIFAITASVIWIFVMIVILLWKVRKGGNE